MKTRILTFVMLTGLAAPAMAQIPVGTKVGEAPSGYDSGGRRDPFASLVVPKRPISGQLVGGRPAIGLSSFSVADVMVTGIVTKGEVRMAILQGSDKQSYVAKLRDRIMDAQIKSIDAQGVVFVELMQPGETARPQEIRKTLRPAAEVIR